MQERPTTLQFEGAAGIIDCALDWPAATPRNGDSTALQPRGWALLLHPHPLYGGARGNKVVTTLSRACTQAGLLAVRPDFRGVGKSEGEYDEGRGETDDMLALVTQFKQRFPDIAAQHFVLGGFSFGSAVATQTCMRGMQSQAFKTNGLILVGTAVSRFDVAEVPADTLVVHGEQDETVDLQGVFDWARPQDLPVVVVPGASHFFHGKLVALKQLIDSYLRSQLPFR